MTAAQARAGAGGAFDPKGCREFVEARVDRAEWEGRCLKVHPLNALKVLRAARAAGHVGAFTTDLAWLVDQAINRRAGWPQDPSGFRGTCRPNASGAYPRNAQGGRMTDLRRLARALNTPRLIVRERDLGPWRDVLLARVGPERITFPGDEAY